MSQDKRRISFGLKNLFARPDVLPTPYKRQNPNSAGNRQKQPRAVLHDDIWDTNKQKSTPHANKTPVNERDNRRKSIRNTPGGFRTPIAPQQSMDLGNAAAQVYTFLANAGFEAATGVRIPANPAQNPMNTDILKMFYFLLDIAKPSRRPDTTIIEMLDDLGYTDMDNSFRRNFSASHVLANTPSMWPKILKALLFITKLIEMARTVEITPDQPHSDESQYLAMLDEEYICSEFFGYNGDTILETLKGYQLAVEQQINESAEKIQGIAVYQQEIEVNNAKVIKTKAEFEAIEVDLAKLEGYLVEKPLHVKSLEEKLEQVNVQLITQHELLQELKKQKVEYARRIEKSGFSLAKLEDCDYELKSLQEDLDGFKAKAPGLEAQSKASREKIAVLKKKIKVLLEQVCDEMGQTVPQETEWPEAVLELFGTLDGLRRNLIIKTSTIQEANISDKINAAAFNSQFDSTQSKQARLEGVVKTVKEQNAFRVRELEIKQALINKKMVSMENQWAEIMRESQLEHSHTREQQLNAEHEGVQLDGKAEQSLRSITSKARSKLQQFDKAESMLLPGLRQLGSSADEYAKTASHISKKAAQFKVPKAPADKGTKQEQISSLMNKWQQALCAAAAS